MFSDKNKLIYWFCITLLYSIGLLLINISSFLAEGFLKTACNVAASASMITGTINIMNHFLLRQSLIEMILSKIGLKSDLDRTGIERIVTYLPDLNCDDYFKLTKKKIVIVHVYGLTWTNTHLHTILDAITERNCKVSVYLYNPTGSFIQPIAEHVGNTIPELTSKTAEVVKIWRKAYCDLPFSKRKNLNIYYHDGRPSKSLYLADDKIIMIPNSLSKGRSKIPAFVARLTQDSNCLYNLFHKEIKEISKNAIRVDLENTDCDQFKECTITV